MAASNHILEHANYVVYGLRAKQNQQTVLKVYVDPVNLKDTCLRVGGLRQHQR